MTVVAFRTPLICKMGQTKDNWRIGLKTPLILFLSNIFWGDLNYTPTDPVDLDFCKDMRDFLSTHKN